jgi:hypothetical protein
MGQTHGVRLALEGLTSTRVAGSTNVAAHLVFNGGGVGKGREQA